MFETGITESNRAAVAKFYAAYSICGILLLWLITSAADMHPVGTLLFMISTLFMAAPCSAIAAFVYSRLKPGSIMAVSPLSGAIAGTLCGAIYGANKLLSPILELGDGWVGIYLPVLATVLVAWLLSLIKCKDCTSRFARWWFGGRTSPMTKRQKIRWANVALVVVILPPAFAAVATLLASPACDDYLTVNHYGDIEKSRQSGAFITSYAPVRVARDKTVGVPMPKQAYAEHADRSFALGNPFTTDSLPYVVSVRFPDASTYASPVNVTINGQHADEQRGAYLVYLAEVPQSLDISYKINGTHYNEQFRKYDYAEKEITIEL